MELFEVLEQLDQENSGERTTSIPDGKFTYQITEASIERYDSGDNAYYAKWVVHFPEFNESLEKRINLVSKSVAALFATFKSLGVDLGKPSNVEDKIQETVNLTGDAEVKTEGKYRNIRFLTAVKSDVPF